MDPDSTTQERVEVSKVDRDSEYYRLALELRRKAFFEGIENYGELLIDADEAKSIHLVAIDRASRELMGYLRLTYESDETARASQLVVRPDLRGNRIWVPLALRMGEIAWSSGHTKVIASARLPGVRLYARIGFQPVGDPYPSLKTGILHQAMEWDLGSAYGRGSARSASAEEGEVTVRDPGRGGSGSPPKAGAQGDQEPGE